MVLIRTPKIWELSENEVTSETVYFNRRSFLKGLVGASIGASFFALTGCRASSSQTALEDSLKQPKIQFITTNPDFAVVDRPITEQDLAGRYNNFYEFGSTKNIWLKAQSLPTENWKVEVTGLVNKPKTYDLDDLKKSFPLEERIYRFRCVEAWSMVLPWVGFPMKELIKAVEPTSQAKFIRFSSYYDSKTIPGPTFHLGALPWPYQESLTIDEMANDLAFLALGIYGHDLPKQHGAPIRAVIPWKYGFKGAKSIVKIEFVEQQPATYWHTIVPNEYDFQANVNPTKPHPRWSQATEKFIGKGPGLSWEIKETLPYNGYGKYVASLYT
ncbi:protein-methionine-sulfoxide reductase catalytic subunit MsrP [Chroococcus sp. FPU101]|uniref:protein-methionine-sulfoxide reductase catalytic subunit MsrP n=1 Tax=Chroococcus sp. FPU101 TaxID=1974212 RepID=UPI001A8F2614|nr:protein-methionine-sulfoxide reductase catalytic subunit MsrP [Chroococcus sp. FPU101]GFE70331.1 oxidoreductase molybdopterin binding [Chroococcus sp. FPU101]